MFRVTIGSIQEKRNTYVRKTDVANDFPDKTTACTPPMHMVS